MILYDNENKPYIKYSSDEVDKVLTAMGNAHSEFKPLQKTGKAQYGVFSSLTDIWSACGESLNKNGLNVISRIARLHSKNMFVLTLFHTESGQYLSSASDMGEYKTIHGYGSLITYFRRYLLTPMLNLEGDYDDDGDTAEKEQKKSDVKFEHNFAPYRYFKPNGDIKSDNISDISEWSQKINGIVYHENKGALNANKQEIQRVLRSIQLKGSESNASKEVQDLTIKTLNKAMEIINE